MLINFVDQTNAANRYTTPLTITNTVGIVRNHLFVGFFNLKVLNGMQCGKQLSALFCYFTGKQKTPRSSAELWLFQV